MDCWVQCARASTDSGMGTPRNGRCTYTRLHAYSHIPPRGLRQSHARKWTHGLIQRVRSMDTRESSFKCSISGSTLPPSLSWMWCRLYCLCGRHPPAHLCPSRPPGPESICHRPSVCRVVTYDGHHRKPPAFKEYKVTERRSLQGSVAVSSASAERFKCSHKNQIINNWMTLKQKSAKQRQQ